MVELISGVEPGVSSTSDASPAVARSTLATDPSQKLGKEGDVNRDAIMRKDKGKGRIEHLMMKQVSMDKRPKQVTKSQET